MKSSASESLRNASAVQFTPSPTGNFGFKATLERLRFGCRTFHVSNLMNEILFITYFASSLMEMSILLVLNFVRLELRSASESIQPI